MSTWRDPERWQGWLRGEDCPICRGIDSEPAVAELEVTPAHDARGRPDARLRLAADAGAT